MSEELKIKEKLKKLLALAASENEHEATLAMQKAQVLMNEYNLTVRDVAEDGSGALIKDQNVSGLTKSCQRWEANLGVYIADTFDGRAIWSRTPEGWQLTFIATKTDLEIIVDLYERLRATVKRMSNTYVRSKRLVWPELPAKTLHNNYRWGMVSTISERLHKLKENTRPEQSTRNQHGYTGKDLMVVKNKAVAQRVTKLFPQLKKSRTIKFTYISDAYDQGVKDGNNVSLHRAVAKHKPASLIIQ